MAMSNATKKALKIGGALFVAGALIGAVVGLAAAGFAFGGITGLYLGTTGTAAALATGTVASNTAVVSAAAANAASAVSPVSVTAFVGICSALGAGLLGAVGGLGGWCYGALTDNAPGDHHFAEAVAHKLADKSPAFAHAVVAHEEQKTQTAAITAADMSSMDAQMAAKRQATPYREMATPEMAVPVQR